MVNYKIEVPSIKINAAYKLLERQGIHVKSEEPIYIKLLTVKLNKEEIITFEHFEKRLVDEFKKIKKNNKRIQFKFEKFILKNDRLLIEYSPNTTAILFLNFVHFICDYLKASANFDLADGKLYAELGYIGKEVKIDHDKSKFEKLLSFELQQ